MSTGLEQRPSEIPPLPPWQDCDFFCFHNYAATGAVPCGWRGSVENVRHDRSGLLCPRCGGATLLRIPPETVN